MFTAGGPAHGPAGNCYQKANGKINMNESERKVSDVEGASCEECRRCAKRIKEEYDKQERALRRMLDDAEAKLRKIGRPEPAP